MTRSGRAACALCGVLLALGGCVAEEARDLSLVPVDSALVAALADVHLADARASVGTDTLAQARRADSLRAVALDAHGLAAAAFERHLDRLAADPLLATATYDAVAERLSRIDLPP